MEGKGIPVYLTLKAVDSLRSEAIMLGECKCCMRVVISNSFRDTISCKEFTISGICQVCQDHIWGV